MKKIRQPKVNPDQLAGAADASHSAQIASVALALIEQIFDQVPEIIFFIKDLNGQYTAVNQSLVERCGLKEKKQLLRRRVVEIFPKELAEIYARQDAQVLRAGQPINNHLEMHWHARSKPGWCLTTKLPIRDQNGVICGMVGISRDLRAPGDRRAIPPSLVTTLEYLESHYQEPISPRQLAGLAGLPPVRFARLIKRIFRLTPTQLILQMRLAAAGRLLAETRHSVAHIAGQCGFYDHSALTRAFRSVTKLTPTQFRALKSRKGN
jgi:PAS domain S-box-containing protein